MLGAFRTRGRLVVGLVVCFCNAAHAQSTPGELEKSEPPRTDGRISYTPHAMVFSEEANELIENGDDLADAVESNRMAVFHAPHTFGMWRNLASSLSKLSKQYMEEDAKADAKAAIQEAAAAFKIAALLGDSSSLDGFTVLKDEVFPSYFGESECIDPLDKSCSWLQDATEALELVQNATTAYDGVKLACNGLKPLTIKVSAAERRDGKLSAANFHKALVALRVCGVLVVDDALAGADHMMDFMQSNYARTTAKELSEQDTKAGIQSVAENMWRLTLPMQAPFTDEAVISNPFVLTVMKAAMKTPGVELDTFSNLINFPGNTFPAWQRDTLDPWLPPSADETTMSGYPPQGIVMLVPLAGQKMQEGPQEFALGSHMGVEMFGPDEEKPYMHLPRTKIPLKKGSVCLFDLRAFHRGTPNKKEKLSSTLYLTYVQDWFTDHVQDTQSPAREFDYLPTVVHQKLLMRMGTRKYMEVLEETARSNGVDVDQMKSLYEFDRSTLTM